MARETNDLEQACRFAGRGATYDDHVCEIDGWKIKDDLDTVHVEGHDLETTLEIDFNGDRSKYKVAGNNTFWVQGENPRETITLDIHDPDLYD